MAARRKYLHFRSALSLSISPIWASVCPISLTLTSWRIAASFSTTSSWAELLFTTSDFILHIISFLGKFILSPTTQLTLFTGLSSYAVLNFGALTIMFIELWLKYNLYRFLAKLLFNLVRPLFFFPWSKTQIRTAGKNVFFSRLAQIH